MKKLPGSIIVVLLTWFTAASVIALFKGDGLDVFALGYEEWLFTSLYGIATGIAGASIYYAFGHRFVHASNLSDHGFKDAAVSVSITDFLKPHASTKTVDYPVPIPPVPRPAEAVVQSFPIGRKKWYVDLREKHPVYADVIDQAYCVMMAKPGVPASPQGGHGGLSLVDHSLNVVDSIVSIRENWLYSGLKTKRGNLYRDLVDPDGKPHAFAEGDPILVVAAFMHDIGKVDCYSRQNGSWEETRPGHGEVGSEMARRMTSVRKLPIIDRDALILAIAYYHHQSDMPIANWVGDRAYSLTGLLYLADCDASAREGDKGEKAEIIASYRSTKAKAAETREATIEETERENESLEQADEDDLATSALEQMSAPVQAGESREQVPVPDQPTATGNSMDVWSAEGGESAFDLFIQAIAMPGAINGKSTDGRFGIKFGNLAYIFEAQVRRRIASMVHDDSINKLKRGQMHPYTQALLMDLSARGFLVQEHAGRQYTWKRALFKAKTSERGEERVIFIIKSAINNGVARLSDAKYAPTITGPLWGEVSAVNKRGATTDSANAGVSAESNPVSTAGRDVYGAGASDRQTVVAVNPVPVASVASPAAVADPDDSPFAPESTSEAASSRQAGAGVSAVAPDDESTESGWSPLKDEHDEAVAAHASPAAGPDGSFAFTEPPVIPEPPRKLPPLDFSMLEAFAISGEKAFGMVSRKLDGGQTAYLFDLEQLKSKYAIDTNVLPDGVGIHHRKSDDKLYIYIAI